MKKKVFRSILLVTAVALCLLCVSIMVMLNQSFASEVPRSCYSADICGLYVYNPETDDLTLYFFGNCMQYYNGGCYCVRIIDDLLVGYESNICRL